MAAHDNANQGFLYSPIANIDAVFVPEDLYFPNKHRVYSEISLPIIYTGKILIGCDPTSTHCIKGVRNNPWKYQNLKECVFESGNLVEIIDHSDSAEDIRKFIRTMSVSEPEYGPMGSFVRFSLPLLGYLSNYPWWIERC